MSVWGLARALDRWVTSRRTQAVFAVVNALSAVRDALAGDVVMLSVSAGFSAAGIAYVLLMHEGAVPRCAGCFRRLWWWQRTSPVTVETAAGGWTGTMHAMCAVMRLSQYYREHPDARASCP